MSEDESNPYEGVGKMSRRERISYSIQNNWDRWGRTDNPIYGVLISLALAGLGVIVYMETSGLLAFAGGVWAILNLLGPVKWVFNQ